MEDKKEFVENDEDSNSSDKSSHTEIFNVIKYADLEIVNVTSYADLKLTFDDGQIGVCKAILCTHSIVFETMLTQNFKEKDANEIFLPEDDYSEILALMKAIHLPLQPKVIDGKIALVHWVFGI